MLVRWLKSKKIFLILGLFLFLALFLRLYKAGQPVFKEDENTTVNAASYLYFCHQDQTNCYHQSDTLSHKLIALLTNNETRPNLITQIYFWDWVNTQPTKIHYARAWPNLHLISFIYQHFNISHLSSRIVSIISGSLLVFVGFFLARLLTLPYLTSLAYAFSLAVSFHLISISRTSRMYALFSLAFLSLIFFISKFVKSKKSIYLPISLFFFFLAYFLQLSTLLLPLAVLVFSLYQAIFNHQRSYKILATILLSLLLLLFYFKLQLNIDPFHSNFIGLQSKPHWQYLVAVFGSKLTSFFGWGLLLINLKKIRRSRFSLFLFSLLITNLVFLIFFFQFSQGSAYVAHLLPISFLLVFLVAKNYLVISLFIGAILTHFLFNLNSLYTHPYDRPQLTKAYHKIINQLQPGDLLIGDQLRPYYLQGSPKTITTIKLSANKIYTYDQFILDSTKAPNNVFIIFEPEKQIRFEPELINYLKTHAKKISGQGINDYQVEIYYLEK